MRLVLSILFLCSCGTSTQPSMDLPSLPFNIYPNEVPLQLDRLTPMKVETQPSQAREVHDLNAFTLDTRTASGANPIGANLEAELPFIPSSNQMRFVPRDMTVRIGGQPIPYATGHTAAKQNGSGWKIHQAALIIASKDHPPGTKVTIETPFLTQHSQRLNAFSSAHQLQFEDQSFSGLLVPAPASVSWKVTLPPHALFSSVVGLERIPIKSAISNGASLTLEITFKNAQTVVSTTQLKPSRPPHEWTVDLSQWAEQTVTLTLRSHPNGDPSHDYAFVGAPTLLNGRPKHMPRRVIVIGLDTTRPDHFSFNGYHRDTSPELDRQISDFTQFKAAWTPAPRTRPSFRSATTGRRPLDAVGAMNIGEIFDREGFATAGIVANIHLNSRFGFDAGFDYWTLNTRAKAEEQVDSALSWLNQHLRQDTYLFLHFMDPHLFYGAPHPFTQRFSKPNGVTLPERFSRGTVLNWMKNNQLGPQKRAEIQARYDGEIAYTSFQVDRFLKALNTLPGNTLIVIHSDHGEEFWEHGGFEHNHTLHEEVTRALLLFRPPKESPHQIHSTMPATLMDIAPTLFDYAGIQANVPLDGQSLKPHIEGAKAVERPIGLGHLMYDKEAWGVVHKGFKYTLETASGKEQLFDLTNDPGELSNLAATADVSPWVKVLSEVHGAPAGPGWRVQLDGRRAPFDLELPEPAQQVAVMDPEAGRKKRANQAWGERPRWKRKDIATVSLSKDGLSVRITPGPHPFGKLLVLFERPVTIPPSAKSFIQGGHVILPPPDEATRMQATSKPFKVEGSERELLKTLGYITEPDPEPSHSSE